MKLLNLNKKIFFSLILFFFTPLYSEDSVNIWKKENFNKKAVIDKTEDISLKKIERNININTEASKEIEINTNGIEISKNSIYGLFDPSENNLTLDMWLHSEGTTVKDTIERISKIKLSSFAEEIFLNTLFTISKLPQRNMTDEEFINYKLDWLINNQKNELISIFLNKNKEFPNKKKIIKYLVNKNIAEANLKDACEKITLINIDVKDSYLDQFKIICLINQNKKNEAQLIHDLLRDQKLSNKFFDNKIYYLLGLNNKEDKRIDDSSLLNFYLSSITIQDFAYIPNKKTDIKIWQYLTAANLLKINALENKEQIRELEIAANNNNFSNSYILGIYKNIKFNFNDLLNIDEVYLTLDPISSRALVYQKMLLSDNTESRLKYLFLLNDLFTKDKLPNVFKEYLNKELKVLDLKKIPLKYKEFVAENIIYEKKNTLGKVSYNNNSYHTSKAIRYYIEENVSKKNVEKELKNIHKKIIRNKKYQISLKDVIFLESLENDKFSIPKVLKYEAIKKNNSPPIELLNLVKNNEIGLFLLRIVELIGEDEILDLDNQTIYFINHLFIKAGLTKFRNKILFTALPERSEI